MAQPACRRVPTRQKVNHVWRCFIHNKSTSPLTIHKNTSFFFCCQFFQWKNETSIIHRTHIGSEQASCSYRFDLAISPVIKLTASRHQQKKFFRRFSLAIGCRMFARAIQKVKLYAFGSSHSRTDVILMIIRECFERELNKRETWPHWNEMPFIALTPNQIQKMKNKNRCVGTRNYNGVRYARLWEPKCSRSVNHNENVCHCSLRITNDHRPPSVFSILFSFFFSNSLPIRIDFEHILYFPFFRID